MTLKDVARARLRNQKIVASKVSGAGEVVAWMGAMQAQDFEMAKWAVGLRLAGARKSVVEAAIDRGEIIRTHLLRPTWHLVSSADIRWMLGLTGPRIKASLATRQRQLELSKAALANSFRTMESTLAGGKELGRKEVLAALERAGVKTDGQRASHILLAAELEGLICSGSCGGRETNYALLDERVEAEAKLSRDEALAKLAMRYFASRGPASLEDFAWWSGLALGDARKGIAANEKALDRTEVDSKTYIAAAEAGRAGATTRASTRKISVKLLPAFDEYIIAYADRSAAITIENRRKAVSNNGIFRPTIVVDGEVVGIWSRVVRQKAIVVENEFFKEVGAETIRQLKKKEAEYVRFCES